MKKLILAFLLLAGMHAFGQTVERYNQWSQRAESALFYHQRYAIQAQEIILNVGDSERDLEPLEAFLKAYPVFAFERQDSEVVIRYLLVDYEQYEGFLLALLENNPDAALMASSPYTF